MANECILYGVLSGTCFFLLYLVILFWDRVKPKPMQRLREGESDPITFREVESRFAFNYQNTNPIMVLRSHFLPGEVPSNVGQLSGGVGAPTTTGTGGSAAGFGGSNSASLGGGHVGGPRGGRGQVSARDGVVVSAGGGHQMVDHHTTSGTAAQADGSDTTDTLLSGGRSTTESAPLRSLTESYRLDSRASSQQRFSRRASSQQQSVWVSDGGVYSIEEENVPPGEFGSRSLGRGRSLVTRDRVDHHVIKKLTNSHFSHMSITPMHGITMLCIHGQG